VEATSDGFELFEKKGRYREGEGGESAKAGRRSLCIMG